MAELTQEYVLSLFSYRDGNLFWKDARSNVKAGDLAGYVRPDDYRKIKINGKGYFAHRLIFIYHHGHLPEFLDHIDRNKLNNSISNIREVTNQQNCMNQKNTKYHNGKPTSSRFKGVTWNKHAKKYNARIRIGGKIENLGYHDSETVAAEAYNTAATKHFGDYACLNIIPQPL